MCENITIVAFRRARVRKNVFMQSPFMTSLLGVRRTKEMNYWSKGLVFVLLICTFCLILIPSSSGLRPKHKLRSRRALSDEIMNCKHWKFQTTDDPHYADINIKLHNSAKKTKKMSVALQCPTMNIINEPNSALKVAPGRRRKLAFKIAVASNSYHKDSSVRQHNCKLSTWNEDAHSLMTCKFNISVWPNGMFYYKCAIYQQGQLTVSESTSLRAKQIKLYNKGENSIIIINSTCKPVVLTLQMNDMYKQLDKGQEWTAEFPLSCSGASSLNYRGKCTVIISHVCRAAITPVTKTEFKFLDGEIEECEHVKSELGRLARSSFAASFGVNDDSSAALALIAIVELLLIILTLVIKVIYVGVTKGWNSSRKELSDRFFNALRINRAKQEDTTTDTELKTEGTRNEDRQLLQEDR